MDAAFYRELVLEPDGAGPRARFRGTVTSNEACGGPWSPQLQHGGPPSALLVLVAERLAAAAGRSGLRAVRLAAEFVAPVPVAPLELSAAVERLSRSAVLVRAELGVAGRTCLQARIWLLAEGARRPEAGERREPLPVQPAGRDREPLPVDPATLPEFGFAAFPYARHLDWRRVSGAAHTPGPGACWVRPRVPLLSGHTDSSLGRAVLIADSASGISSELDWDAWSFANVDLDVHLFRPLAGAWLLVDAVTELGAGTGLASSRLSDGAGPAGAGLQTLLLRPRD